MMPTMWSGVLFEEKLEPEVVTPEQFYQGSRRKLAVMPEMALAQSVLERAIFDLQEYRYGKRRRDQRLYMDAYEWVACDDRRWPFSFINLCEILNLPADVLRARLIENTKPVVGPSSPYRLYSIDKAA